MLPLDVKLASAPSRPFFKGAVKNAELTWDNFKSKLSILSVDQSIGVGCLVIRQFLQIVAEPKLNYLVVLLADK